MKNEQRNGLMKEKERKKKKNIIGTVAESAATMTLSTLFLGLAAADRRGLMASSALLQVTAIIVTSSQRNY